MTFKPPSVHWFHFNVSCHFKEKRIQQHHNERIQHHRRQSKWVSLSQYARCPHEDPQILQKSLPTRTFRFPLLIPFSSHSFWGFTNWTTEWLHTKPKSTSPTGCAKRSTSETQPRWPTGQQGLRAHVPGGTAPLDWSSHSEVCGSRSNSFSFSLLGSPGQKYSFRERQRGYSYLEEKQYKGKSKFLKEFYIGERPNF